MIKPSVVGMSANIATTNDGVPGVSVGKDNTSNMIKVRFNIKMVEAAIGKLQYQLRILFIIG